MAPLEPLEPRRMLAGGSVDPSFGGGSMVAIGFAAGSSVLNDVLVYPDGSVLTGGYAVPLVNNQPSDVPQMALAKYNFAGQLDASFGIGGQIYATPRGLKGALDMALLDDGSFLVLGSSASGYSTRANVLLKLTPGGKVDNTFGTKGRVTLPVSAATVHVGAGNAIFVAGQQDRHGAVVNYLPTGRLNTSFGTAGIFSTATVFDPDLDATFFFDSLAIDSQGRLYAAGSHRDTKTGVDDFTLLDVRALRIHSDGTSDGSFGNGGSYFSVQRDLGSIGLNLNPDGAAFGAIAIGSDDVAVIVASASNGQNAYAARLLADGAPDPAFAGDGVADLRVKPARYPIAGSVQVQVDGKILFAGLAERSGRNVFSIERLGTGGVPDTTYGDQGVSTVLYKKIAGEARVAALAPDGSIVVGGVVGSAEAGGINDSRRFAVTRLFGEEGPAGQLIPKTLRASQAGFLFDVVWRDDDPLSQLTIDGGDLRLFGIDGIARRAKLSAVTVSLDGKLITARYRLPAVNGTVFTPADNGNYQVKVLNNQVSDNAGAFASKRSLGIVRVRIV